MCSLCSRVKFPRRNGGVADFPATKGVRCACEQSRGSHLVNILYLKQNVQSTPRCFNQMPLPALSVLVSVLCKAPLRPFLRASPKNGGSYKVDVFATWSEEIYLKQLGGDVFCTYAYALRKSCFTTSLIERLSHSVFAYFTFASSSSPSQNTTRRLPSG